MSNKNIAVTAIDAGGHRERVRARRDELVEKHLSLVEGIARAVARTLPPCFDIEDLVGVGNIALLHLATRYRPGEHGGAPFSAYARPGIRGAIVDSVRRNRYLEATRPGLTLALHAVHGENIGDVFEQEHNGLAIEPTHDERVDAGKMARKLAEAVSWLPKPEQAVLQAFYSDSEPTLREVSARFAFSPKKTRKLHAAAIEGLRARFKLAA